MWKSLIRTEPTVLHLFCCVGYASCCDIWHVVVGVAESCTEAATLAPGYGTICILIHTGAPVWSLFTVLFQSL